MTWRVTVPIWLIDAMTTSDSIRERLRSGLISALRQRDRGALSAYRHALAAIDNAETIVPDGGVPSAGAVEEAAVGVGASDVPRRVLTDDDVRAVVRAEIAEHESAAHLIAEHDASRADGHRRAAALLEGVLG